MWLLNTETFKLEEFYSDVPSYAILSHRWRKDEEVSFGGLEEPHPHSNRTGYKKIKDFCAEARKSRFTYVWVDTCCIDKKSSAELSEAINSMYGYYSRAKTCYVYLFDVSVAEDFKQSSWFTRGWTLQELLAPPELHFFNREWKPIGSRTELAADIQSITRIPEEALQKLNLAQYCVAEKLLWSAKRQTSREEDRAYSLLGLFQINMPLLYGEGTRAFQRLQEEIMKISTDMSIFMWQGPAVDAFGMLALDPSCFSRLPAKSSCWAARRSHLRSLSKHNGWTLNNSGFDMVVTIYPYLFTADFECVYALALGKSIFSSQIYIFVEEFDGDNECNRFRRVTVDGIAWTTALRLRKDCLLPSPRTQAARILRQPLKDISTPAVEFQGFNVRFCAYAPCSFVAYQRPAKNPQAELRSWQAIGTSCAGSLDCTFPATSKSAPGLHGYVLFTLVEDIQIMICLGLDFLFQPLLIWLPFCKPILDQGLDCASILNHVERAHKRQGEAYEFFDKDVHMFCFLAYDYAIHDDSYMLNFTLTPEFRMEAGRLEADISVDLQKFLRYYIPSVDMSTYDSIKSVPRQLRDTLQKTELEVDSMRRDNNFPPIRRH